MFDFTDINARIKNIRNKLDIYYKNTECLKKISSPVTDKFKAASDISMTGTKTYTYSPITSHKSYAALFDEYIKNRYKNNKCSWK